MNYRSGIPYLEKKALSVECTPSSDMILFRTGAEPMFALEGRFGFSRCLEFGLLLVPPSSVYRVKLPLLDDPAHPLSSVCFLQV